MNQWKSSKILFLQSFLGRCLIVTKAVQGTLIAGAVAGAVGLSPATAATGSLQGDELRDAISGRTVLLNTGMGFELPISYSSNGTMAGRVQAMAAALVGETRPHDSGRWWITETQLCQRWSNWLDGKTYCFDLVRKGQMVYWRSSGGHSGTARISN